VKKEAEPFSILSSRLSKTFFTEVDISKEFMLSWISEISFIFSLSFNLEMSIVAITLCFKQRYEFSFRWEIGFKWERKNAFGKWEIPLLEKKKC
jgi:hypothetical protein